MLRALPKQLKQSKVHHRIQQQQAQQLHQQSTYRLSWNSHRNVLNNINNKSHNNKFLSPISSSLLFKNIGGISLRNMSSVTAAPTFAKAATPTSNTPTINDVLVELTFVDPKGARRKVKGMVGKTLLETCIMHDIDLGPHSIGGTVEARRSDTWVEPLYGEGVTSGFDHVILAGNGIHTGPHKTKQEQDMIDLYWDWDEIYDNSRLACCVVLTKDMDGMVVYVPDRIVDDYM